MLHMPQALDVCREFLVKMEQYDLACKQTALTFIFKPVATHKPLPCMLKKNDSIRVSHNVILRSSESLFKSVGAEEKDKIDDQSQSKTLQISVETIKDDDGKTGRVILDVACCDGPVRFHRVLNDEYGSEAVTGSERGDSEDDMTNEGDEVGPQNNNLLLNY
jgi:hypothetical protein